MDKLVPFRPHGGAYAVLGFLSFAKGRLHLKYELRDPSREVLGSLVNGSHPGSQVERADELWRSTCFEAFFGEPGKSAYWELNLAPDGTKWNLYRFDSYRAPQPPSRSDDFTLERLTIRDGTLDAVLRTGLPIPKLDASLCAVILTAAGPEYYALTHAGAKADFHLRGSFCVSAGS